ncbi:MAG: tetratricopeptide repeat protein [Chthonomonadales bacterium]
MVDDTEPNVCALDRARAALAAGDALAAVAQLSGIVALSPEDAEAWEWLGAAQLKAGNLAQARDALERATILEPQRPRAHLQLARVLKLKQEYDYAIQEVQAALLLDPHNVEAKQLQEDLAQDLRALRDHTTEGFAVVKSAANPLEHPPGVWAQLPCPICGFHNFITARTCARCGSLLPEGDDMRPAE